MTGVLRQNPQRYGGYVVHLGVALMLIGFAGSLGRTQTEAVTTPGGRFTFSGYTFTYERLETETPPDKDVNRAVVALSRDGERVGTLHPQLNFHHNWEQPQSEIAIRSTPVADLYVILAGVGEDGRAIFRIHRNPLVMWVWLGAFVSLVGGLVALATVPRRRREEVFTAPALERV